MGYVIAALGHGYVQLSEDTLAAEVSWTEWRDEAHEWESRRAAEQQLKIWKKSKRFPAHAGVLPGPNV